MQIHHYKSTDPGLWVHFKRQAVYSIVLHTFSSALFNFCNQENGAETHLKGEEQPGHWKRWSIFSFSLKLPSLVLLTPVVFDASPRFRDWWIDPESSAALFGSHCGSNCFKGMGILLHNWCETILHVHAYVSECVCVPSYVVYYNCTFHISSSFTILLIVIPLKVRRTWTSLTWLGRLSSKPQGFSRLCCFGTGITDLCCHAWHFTCDLQIELKILWLHVRRLATKHILRSQKILIRTFFFQGF